MCLAGYTFPFPLVAARATSLADRYIQKVESAYVDSHVAREHRLGEEVRSYTLYGNYDYLA